VSKDVEDKIVSLTFKNEKFKAAAADTIKALEAMQKSLKGLSTASAMADVKPTLGALDSLKAKLTGFRKDTGDKPLVDMTPTVKAMQDFSAKASSTAIPVTTALGDVQAAADDIDMTPAGESASMASAKFIAFAAAAGAAMYAIGAKAVQMAGSLASSFTLEPMKAGFQEFETNMGSIQTILANTDRFGTKLPEVTANLDDLNEYSDKTIYNFGDMVKNIGLFTNAGIRIGDATSMIKGFSNAAAASGTNAEQAAGAAYQLSQALSAGKVTLMDWKSLQNAGMGNKNMQQGLVELADSMGTISSAGTSAKEIQENFNGSLEKGWLKADVMSNYLKIMAGDMSEAEMKTLGLTDAQVKWYQRQQGIAEDAATKVRTLTQLLSTVKESIGSGWSETFRNIIGGFDEGTELFTGINNAISGIVGNSAKARNDLLAGWKAFGGRTALIDGLKNSWQALIHIVDPIRLAFRSIFPRETAKGLIDLTTKFRDFTKGLMASQSTVSTVASIFRGFFALVKIGASIIWQVGKLVVSVFRDAFGGATSIGIMPFIASIGDVIANVSKFLSEGGRLKNFFAALQGAIHHVLGPFKGLVQVFIAVGKVAGILVGGALKVVIGVLRELFGTTAKQGKGAADTMAAFLDKITRGMIYTVYYINLFADKLRSADDLVKAFAQGLKDIPGAFRQIKEALLNNDVAKGPWQEDSPILVFFFKLHEILGKIKSAFMGGFSNPFAEVQASGIGGFIAQIGKAFGLAWDKIKEFGDGGKAIFDGIKKSIEDADWLGMLKDVGHKLKESFMTAIDAHSPSRVFIEAAKSIPQGIAEGIRSAWDSIKQVFSDMGGKLKEWFNEAKDVLGEASGDIDWNQVIQGGGVAALIGFVKVLSDFRKDMGGLIESMSGTFDELGGALQGLQKKLKAEALKELAIAIAILVAAVLILTFVDPDKLKMALAAIAIGFTELAGTMKLMDKMSSDTKGMLAIGAAFLGLGIAIILLATAVKMMADLSWDDMLSGLGAVGVLMAGLVIAVNKMPDKAQLAGVATTFLAIGASIAVMAIAVKLIGEMSAADIFQGVVAIGVLAAVLVVAANQMDQALPGATAMVAAAGSILILAEATRMIGKLDYEAIKNGVLAIGALMFMLVLATNSMETAMPGAIAMVAVAGGILILAQAMTIIGELSVGQIFAGLAAITALIAILGIFVVAITATGEIAIPAMEALGTTLLLVGAGFALIGVGAYLAAEALRIFAENGSKGMDTFIEMLKRLVGLAPELVRAFVDSIIDMAIQLADRFPEVLDSFGNAFMALLVKIQEVSPMVFETLQMLLDGVIQMVIDSTPGIMNAAFTLITSFLLELTAHALEFGEVAATLMAQFILGIANNVLPMVNSAVLLITNFMNAITLQMPALTLAGANLIVAFINGIALNSLMIVNAASNAIVMILQGLGSNMAAITKAGSDLIIDFLTGVEENMQPVIDKGVAVILKFISGLATNVETFATAAGDFMLDLLDAIDGAVQTYTEQIAAKGRSIAWHLVSGIATGLIGNDAMSRVKSAVKALADAIPDWAKKMLGINSPSRVMMEVAKWIPLGMAKGIDDHAGAPLASVTNLGDRITAKFQDALAGVPDVLNGMDEMNPVIAPVLDLTQVTSDARKINGLVDTINPSVSLGAAKLISSTEDVRGNGSEDGTGGTVINKTFIQNNHSPEALSANDIYRNTKSQFAMEREDLESA
jgi:tape measure domain-containing protein